MTGPERTDKTAPVDSLCRGGRATSNLRVEAAVIKFLSVSNDEVGLDRAHSQPEMSRLPKEIVWRYSTGNEGLKVRPNIPRNPQRAVSLSICLSVAICYPHDSSL